WLDGLSDGEQAIEELLDLAMGKGAAALNIIPDRNWNLSDPALKARKVAELHKVVRIANERHLPVIVGTELNAYGQPFVDNFDVPEMAPLFETFQQGAFILHAHTVLQTVAGMGYLSDWATRHFPAAADRNAYFARLGAEVLYPDVVASEMVHTELHPDRVLEILCALDPAEG
ncbi:MAG: hypothetical protein Q8N51_16870, partial [Gammaproteobacteria bacterium]|nr:hypothetical protein [Gammaproteobacteria bacterium]